MPYPITIRDTGVRITEVLDMLAKAHSFEQIVKAFPSLTLSDIMVAAATASRLINEMVVSEDQVTVDGELKIVANKGQFVNLTSLRKDHPRAYVPWSREEQEQMVALFQQGNSIKQISEALERQPGAIQSRLARMGLLKPSQRTERGPQVMERAGVK